MRRRTLIIAIVIVIAALWLFAAVNADWDADRVLVEQLHRR